jgi:hypothetical protein
MLVVPVLFLALGGGVASLELPPAAAVYVARGERTGGVEAESTTLRA